MRVAASTYERCYLYPEVSANVQSYIRSPAAQAKLHLFVDVGAGTVDLSAFIWNPASRQDRPLSYLAADVLPLGASQIELRAANRCSLSVEDVRACKEGLPSKLKHESIAGQCLYWARESINDDLRKQAVRVLQTTKDLIPTARRDRRRESQFFQMHLLMGGGGSCEPLYTRGIRDALLDIGIINAPTLALPLPSDLRWPAGTSRAAITDIYQRLTVAYGLSFLRADLPDQWLPKEIEIIANSDDEPRRYSAPSKDET